MAKYCWHCANIGKCEYASGRIIRCNRFNPYISVEEFCTELGISMRQFNERTRNGKSIKGLQKDAREKGIVIIKDWTLNKKKYNWVIYRKKM